MHILGAIGSVVIISLMLPGFVSWWENGLMAQQQHLAAEHLSSVTQAARKYVNLHQDTLLTQTGASSGPVIGIADLVNDNLLPDGFQPRNVWLQDYDIHLRQPVAGSLAAIVLTRDGRNDESDKFRNVTVPGAAALAGGAGGYVPSGIRPGHSENMLQGAGNGWLLDLDAVGIASPGAGHLGALSSYDSSALGQDFLYRVPVPGMPELNSMQTDLDMTDHALKHVSEIQFEQRQITDESCTQPEEQGRVFLDEQQGLYLCRNNSLEIIGDSGNSTALKSVNVVANGARIPKPVCAPGSGTVPSIVTAPAIAEAGPVAPPLSAVQTWATSVSDTEWIVRMRVLTSNKSLAGSDSAGWVYPSANYGRIMVMSMCVKQS